MDRLNVIGLMAGAAVFALASVRLAAGAEPGGDDRAGAAADEASLAHEARLGPMVRLARARNPELQASRERALAAQARAAAEVHLPDTELKYEQWQVPLTAPLSLDRAGMLMVGLRQTFPPLGTRAARGRMADQDTAVLGEVLHARDRDIAVDVRRAYGQYWRAETEYRVHQEHVGLLAHIVDMARAHYQTGHVSQQDLLRLTVELSQLHNDVATLEQERHSSRAQLNLLMGRPPEAPLGPPPEDAIRLDAPEASSGAAPTEVDERRPEIASAARMIQRQEAALEVAQRSARWPSVTVGADYWYLPQTESSAYGAMVMIDLPWLNGRHRDEINEAEHALAAEHFALEAQRNQARFEVRDARVRVEAAAQAVRIIDGDLLPLARRSFESAEAAYEAGQGSALALLDAMRSYLQVRLERTRALSRLDASRADYQRAAGIDPGDAS